MYKWDIQNIYTGTAEREAAGDKQPAGSGGGLEALCRSAGEKLRAGLYRHAAG